MNAQLVDNKSARASCISLICQISVYYYDITLSVLEKEPVLSAHLDAEISSDGAGGRVSRVGGSQHDTTSLDSIETLPHHRNHRATDNNNTWSGQTYWRSRHISWKCIAQPSVAN